MYMYIAILVQSHPAHCAIVRYTPVYLLFAGACSVVVITFSSRLELTQIKHHSSN